MLVHTENFDTNPLVYHVSYRCHRNSILTKGILASSSAYLGYTNAVFAHNSPLVNIQWYPLCLDWYGWELNVSDRYIDEQGWAKFVFLGLQVYYDIWAINTQQLKQKWYLDKTGERETEEFDYKQKNLFVMSYGSIPPEAIQLSQPQLKNNKVVLAPRSIDVSSGSYKKSA